MDVVINFLINMRLRNNVTERRGKSLHACIIMPHTGKKKLSTGINSTREVYRGCGYGKHAEMDAIWKLPRLPCKKKPVGIDILVIKIKRDGSRSQSRPCQKCCEFMYIVAPKKGYIVRTIYYSVDSETIESIQFPKLWDQRDLYVSTGFKR